MIPKITIDVKDTATRIKIEEAKKNTSLYAFRGINQALFYLQSVIVKNLSGGILSVKTGSLRRSWGASSAIEMTQSGNTITGKIGSNLKYAKIQNEGGRITPSRASWLTIPVPENTSPKTAREYQNTFFAKKMMFQKVGSTIRRLFYLSKGVTIPASRYLDTSVSQARPKMISIIRLWINRAAEI